MCVLQVILMAGLQGVGKTTACGKLALYLKGQGKTVSMVATDVYRPAAIDQLVRCPQADRPCGRCKNSYWRQCMHSCAAAARALLSDHSSLC